MDFIQHPTANLVLTPPPGATPEECRPLPVTRIEAPDTRRPSVFSFWQPSEEERAAIAAGWPVYLRFDASTHPPVYVGVEQPGEPFVHGMGGRDRP